MSTSRFRGGMVMVSVVLTLLLLSFLGVMIFNRSDQGIRTLKRHQEACALERAAEAGIVHGFHVLKGGDLDHALAGPLEVLGTLGEASYHCQIDIDGTSKTVRLTSTGRLGDRHQSRSGRARYMEIGEREDRKYWWRLRYE